MHVAINAVLFQCLWFATILLGWQYALVPAAIMGIHAYKYAPKELMNAFIPLFILMGFIWDSVLVSLGLFVIQGEPLALGVMPLWLLNCWIGVSLSLGLSLGWWSRYPRAFVVACAMFAPLSYFAGMRFGVLSFELFMLPVLAVAWAVFAALILWGLPKAMNAKAVANKGAWQSCES